MEINLKSSVGRSFSAALDPVTVGVLLGLATQDAEARLSAKVLQDFEFLSGLADGKIPADELSVNSEAVVAKYSMYLAVRDAHAPSVMEAYWTFLAEYKLLQTGAGSERACMEAFMSLCELLQGD